MGEIEDNFYHYFGIVAFVIAISVYIPLNKTVTNLTLSVKKDLSSRKEMYEYSPNIIDSNQYMSYAELIGTLILEELKYDIVVDDMTYDKSNHHYSKVDFDKISKSAYTKTYQYNEEGNIVKVILKRISP